MAYPRVLRLLTQGSLSKRQFATQGRYVTDVTSGGWVGFTGGGGGRQWLPLSFLTVE
ncbi:hypothetical protein SAMN05444064_12842 [Pseudomonas syringae]|nr:hypothetical protein SAMN05444514_12942 [Pseudomonas syringae]SFM72110.1 hypothetical protein SAMN05444064_12842 [Pseudomonas syringae]